MKKFIIIIFSVLCLVSCSDFLEEDPKGKLSPENYASLTDLDKATIALFPKINTMFNEIECYSPLFGGDDVTAPNAGNKIPFLEFCIFNPTSFNSRYKKMWVNGYGVIKSANAIIQNYEGVDESEEVKQNWAGQAFFARALAYYFLVRVWGDIPLVTTLDVDLNIEKSHPADIFALIVSDLQIAEKFLPDSWNDVYALGKHITKKDFPNKIHETGVTICPTSGTAKALLASVYLTMAGWPLKQTESYALAAEKAKEVIDGVSDGTYPFQLLTNYADLWKPENKFNDEIVFGAYFNIDAADTHWGNKSMLGPSMGIPFDEGGWNDYMAEITFFNNFPAGPRKDATFQTEIYVGNDSNNVVSWQDGQEGHPYYKKYTVTDDYDISTHKGSNWICDRTVYIIRYAEVLLVYAEAQAMANGADASAYQAINDVRNRAGLPDLTAGLNSEAFKDSVVAERGWEFAGLEPCARWFDLQRTETVETANANRHANETPIEGDPSEHYYAPVPIDEKLLNDNL